MTRPMSKQIIRLFVLTLWTTISLVESWTLHPQTPTTRKSTILYQHKQPQENTPWKRRQLFVSLGASILSLAPTPSWALKPRNEQLCGTGFFTNYLEYRCTEIGDISDEGQRTSLSSTEAGAADSLLSKLNLDLGEDGGATTQESDDKQAPPKVKAGEGETQ